MLYGVTERGQIVTIDAATGRATQVSRLNMPFEFSGRAIANFNPVPDRLRLMGKNGTNFRVNVGAGEVARDGTLKHGQGVLSGTTPRISASLPSGVASYILTAGTTNTAFLLTGTTLPALNLADGVVATCGAVTGLPAAEVIDIAAMR